MMLTIVTVAAKPVLTFLSWVFEIIIFIVKVPAKFEEMNEKTSKVSFKIKLSEETSTKLKTTTNDSNTPDNITSTLAADKNATDKSHTKITILTPEEGNSDLASDINTSELPSETPEKSITDDTQSQPQINYEDHMHYEGDLAIYTDPSTKQQHVWCQKVNQWIPRPQSDSEKKDSEHSPEESSERGDDEVKYGYEDNKHTYTDKDGTVFFWDEEKKAWFPKVDEDFLAHYQMAYGFVDNTTNVESDKAAAQKKEEEEEEDAKVKADLKRKPEEPKWFDMAEEQNTKVYVSNLPLDITEEEFVDIMQKCGLIMKDLNTQKLKIKLYTKPNSQALKGDGLCTYIKVESVELALKILDGYLIRDHRIQVQRAKFQMKGDFNPALKPKKKRKKDKEKLKKLQERLFDWRPEKMRGERSKHERVVIIKNLFEPSLFDDGVHLILDYQQDLREECSKCGEVKKVALYDRHPEGVAQIIMKEPEEAESVVALLNGRWFEKRQLSAEIWDGKTKYKMQETDADLNKRLDGWSQFLDDKDDKSKAEPTAAVPTPDADQNKESLEDWSKILNDKDDESKIEPAAAAAAIPDAIPDKGLEG